MKQTRFNFNFVDFQQGTTHYPHIAEHKTQYKLYLFNQTAQNEPIKTLSFQSIT